MNTGHELLPDRDYLIPTLATSPVFWIKEIRILNQLEPGAEAEIRRIPLQEGLNIVWAKPSDPNEKNPEARGRGHDVGKSTFCRLIRHLMGEKSYGTESTRKAIAACEKLGHPWVIGQFMIRGESWIAARPLYSGGHPFAARGMDIDEALVLPTSNRLKYKEEFLPHLETEILRDFPVHHFDSRGQRPILWLHLLQWLARDQETHLASRFKWRESSSDSGSPDVPVPDAHFIIRCLFAVTDTEERRVIAKRAELDEQRIDKLDDLKFHERRMTEAVKKARDELPDGQALPDVGEELFIDQIVRHAIFLVEARRLALESQIEALDLTNAESKLEKAVGLAAIAEQQHAAEQQRLNEAEDELERFESGGKTATLDQLEQILTKLSPDRDRCEVPTNIALFRCPILREYRQMTGDENKPTEPEARGTEELTARARTEVLSKMRTLRASIGILEKKRDETKLSVKELRTKRDQLRVDLEDLNKKIAALSPEVIGWELRAKEARDSYLGLDSIRSDVAEIDRNLEILKSEQDLAQKETKTRQIEIGKIFEALCKYLKGDSTAAKLRFTRDSISARIGSGGGAYNALTTVLFDYTALLSKLQGIGHHPGFLMHDSPRESDMEQSLYRPLFHLIKHLADKAPSSFQYIITTTEEPPPELTSTHVVAVLDASADDGFLFRTRF